MQDKHTNAPRDM